MRPALPLAALMLASSLAAAQAPEAQAPATGDRIVVGGSVRHQQPVGGDLMGMGGDFELAAPVRGNAVIAAGNVAIRGSVGNDLVAGGGNVTLAAEVTGDARLAGGNVEVQSAAKVDGDLSVAGGDVLIDAQVGGDVHAAAGDLALGPNARIGGRLVHRSGNLRVDPAAQVAGGVEQARPRKARDERHARAGHSGGGWFWSVGVIALAALIAGAFPAASRRIGGELRASPGLALLFGFAVLVCVPVAAIVFMITIVGIPVALVVLLLYFLLLFVGYAATGVMIGDAALARWRAQDAARAGWRVGAAVVAMLGVSLLGRVPVVGGLVVFAALLAGIGAIVITFARARAAPTPAAS